jgi:hypothetical protein
MTETITTGETPRAPGRRDQDVRQLLGTEAP